MAENKDLQYITSFYRQPEYEKYEIISPDYLSIIYRDNSTGEKKIKFIEEPTYKYYIAKPTIDLKHNLRFISKKDVNMVKCRYRDLDLDIATRTNMKDFYYECIYTAGKRAELRKLHHIYEVFGTDFDINDYYKKIFLDQFHSSSNKLTKAYYDIEADSVNLPGFSDEHEAKAPINAISLLIEENMTMYILLLDHPEEYLGLLKYTNPQLEEFKRNKFNEKKYLLDKYKEDGIKNIKIKFFDKEIDLITKFFSLINKYKPDFALAWNARFDIQTMLNRIINLGYDPKDICTHPDFRDRPTLCYFQEDNKAREYGRRNDTFYLSSYTEFLDQLIIYAGLRIGQGVKRSFKLNIIAKEEISSEKIDFSEIGTIKTLPYNNYKLFVEYNMKDVLLLYLLEKKNMEVDLMYTWGNMIYTRLNKVLKKSISLYNAFAAELEKKGYIIGNNVNNITKDIGKNYTEDDENEFDIYGQFDIEDIGSD